MRMLLLKKKKELMLPKEGWGARKRARRGSKAREGGLTIVNSYNEGRVCVVLHVLQVLSVHLSPSGNGTGVRINLQPVGSIPPNPIPEKAQALA